MPCGAAAYTMGTHFHLRSVYDVPPRGIVKATPSLLPINYVTATRPTHHPIQSAPYAMADSPICRHSPHRRPALTGRHPFADIPTARYLRFRCPVPTFGSGVLLFAAKAYAPGRISTPWSHLDSTQTWRAHARRHLCPMCPPHRGPDPRPRPDGSRNARLRRLVPPRDRPRDRPQRHPPHQPVLHLARTGHRRPAMAP